MRLQRGERHAVPEGAGGVEESLPKYRVVKASSLSDLEMKITALADAGYKIRDFIINTDLAEWAVAVMKLEDKGKYEGIDSLIKVDLEDVDTWLERGYEVAVVYSKHAVLVHKREKI